MDFETLRILVDVIQRRSFSEVARKYDVAPSSISRSISALETQLGVRLLNRNTRTLEPTEAGRLYAERIAPLLNEIDAANTFASEMSQELQGRLRVTAGVTYGEICLVPLLGDLAQRFPKLQVELVLTDAVVDLIEERIDLAVRVGNIKNSSYVARRLSDMRMHVCASPQYLERRGVPEKPSDISAHQCLLFPLAGYDLNWTFKDRQGRLTQVVIYGQYQINNSHSIRTCCVNGMGISLLPDWLIKEQLQTGQLVSLLPEYQVTATEFDVAIWLVHSFQNYLPLKARVFMDFLLEKFADTK